MLGFVLLATFIVMLGLIWFHQGWKKGLKILGLWLGSFVILVIIERLLGIENKSATSGMLSLLVWGLWVIGLVIYNIKEGYIGHL
jgi:hypothetical protein